MKDIAFTGILVGISIALGLTTGFLISEIVCNPNPPRAVSEVKQPHILIYAATWCHYCTALEKRLDDKGIPYTVKYIDKDPAAEKEMIAKSGARFVPQVYEDGKFIGSGSTL